MTQPTQDDILFALSSIKIPETDQNIVSQGMVSSLVAKERSGGLHVQIVIDVDPSQATAMEAVRKAAVAAVQAIGGVTDVTAVLSAHTQAPPLSGKKEMLKNLPDGVKRVIAVASGKGGVGKSTFAANLALSFAKQGMKVGLLDADVYGPSVPRLLGLSKEEVVQDEVQKKLLPIEACGIKVMSIGLLVDEETPMIWRGPMVHGAIKQMLYDVAWENLDLLVLDMPPGTGDAALSVAQQVPLVGAVIVSTPQDLALLDVRKSIAMFRKSGVPILGLIENMSSFECPHCKKSTDIFGCGGARDDAERLGVDFLGEIPLTLEIRESADAGEPIVLSHPDSSSAQAITEIAVGLMDVVGEQDLAMDQ